MTIEARLEDGRVLRFPDGTSQDVIQSTVRKVLGVPISQAKHIGSPMGQASRAAIGIGQGQVDDPTVSGRRALETNPAVLLARETAAGPMGGFRTGAISAGRGLFKIARALGIADPETEEERRAFEALEQERPFVAGVGEIVGESLPFVGVPVGAIPGTAARIGAATGLGALEGALIRRGEGATETEQLEGASIGGLVAGGLEAALPVVGRLGGKIIRRITGRAPRSTIVDSAGRPTEELSDALEQSGVSFDDLQEAAMELISTQGQGVVPEQAARAARFEDLGIPATRGDITQQFKQQAEEARIFEAAADPLGDPLRSLRLQQSEGIRRNLESTIERAGVPENVGEAIKDALSGRKATLRAQKNALYRKAAQAAENVGALPFPTDGISNALPDQRTLSRLTRIRGNQVEPVMDLLGEFGIIPPREGIEPIQLSIENFDEFRIALGQLERADETKATSIVVGPIREALDAEAENISTTMVQAGAPDSVLEPLKAARDTVRQLKTEFDPKGIVERLIAQKGQSADQVIEASQVYKQIVGTSRPIELLERTVDSLKKAGPDGIKAIGDLQAATVLDLLESAFKAETRRVQGVKTFGSVPFQKRLAQIGDEKLNIIFSTNRTLLAELKKVASVADDLIPPSGAIPKGSASVILDTMNLSGIMTIMGKVPGGGLFAEGFTMLAEGQKNRAALARALDARPDLLQTIRMIESELPSVLAAMGIAGALGRGEDRQEQIQNVR